MYGKAMKNRLDDIIAGIAHRNGVSPEEVRREMEAAISLAFSQSPKPPDVEKAQLIISPDGSAPSLEEFICACVKMCSV